LRPGRKISTQYSDPTRPANPAKTLQNPKRFKAQNASKPKTLQNPKRFKAQNAPKPQPYQNPTKTLQKTKNNLLTPQTPQPITYDLTT
jgi:hypothetical protein